MLAVLLALAGAGGPAANAASGRVVLGWFPKEQRGVAMGFRQTAQPLGVAVAGAVAPRFATVQGALLAMAVICAVTAVAVLAFVRDPARGGSGPASRTASPYRSAGLWRVHGASALLVVPQFATAAFAVTYLVSARGWDVASAGQLVAAAQFLGAAGRLACGRWSDAVGSRVRPMRQLALVNGAVMVLLAGAGFGVAFALAGALALVAAPYRVSA